MRAIRRLATHICVCSFFSGAALAALLMSTALAEGRIYVIRESDGTIRFTNREPAPGVRAELFTSKGRGTLTYVSSGRGVRRPGRIYPHLFSEIIQDAAEEHRVDAALIKAVIHAESAFNPRAVSPKGAQGLMQLMPGTARSLGVKNAFTPESNIHGGTRYLAKLLRRYGGNVSHALAAYNAGDEPVQRYKGVPPFTETQQYVRRVLMLKKQYSTVSHG